MKYKTKDFYNSVVLKVVGLPFVGLENGDGRFSVFVFEDADDKAKDILKSYWNSEVRVDARKMVETINELKTRLHEGV